MTQPCRPLLVAVAGLVSAIMHGTAPACAQDDPARANELAATESQLRKRAAEERKLKDEAASRQKEIEALRKQMIDTAKSVQASERRVAAIEAELEELDIEEAKIGTSMLVERQNLGEVLAALQSLERSRPPALLVSPNDANRAARAAMLLAGAAPEIEARATALRVKLSRLAEIRKTRDRERSNYEKTNAEIEQRRTVLAELLAKKQQERDVATSLAAAAQRETAALAARAGDIRGVIERLDRLATAITPRVKPRAPKPDAPARPDAVAIAPVQPAIRPPRTKEVFAPGAPFVQAKGALLPPVVGALAGRFGATKPEGGTFEGVRFAVRDKAIVTAPHEGNVAFAQPYGPLGNVIILDVGAGYHVLLIGVSNLLVEEGQSVSAGEPVGSIAANPGGEAYLDFEIRRNQEPVNPSLWLGRQTAG